MSLAEFREQLKSPYHTFADTLAFIDKNYNYQPTAFKNGEVENAKSQNEGSCKVLGLAMLENFSDEETLLAFAEHYRTVLATPDGEDHQNIRSLQKNGLKAVSFELFPLMFLNQK